MSIKRKLTLVMMSISLAAVMLTVTAITAYLIYDMHKSKLQELGVMAAITGDRNSAALLFLDSDRARRNLEIFRLNPSIRMACVYDAKGALFAGYAEENAETACPPTVNGMPHVLPDRLTAFREITQNGETAGSIFMAADTREIEVYVRKIVLISVSAALLVLGVTLLLTVYFQRTISGPILELAGTVQRITEKRDYTLEAKAVYPDETGVLARAFNAMLNEVHKRDAELVHANETLEQKVMDRTQQLEDAKQKAEAASEAKSEFLRNMSHEFRTPLHAILSFSSYGIKEHETTPRSELKHYFELIQKGSERLSRLVDEVLDLAKIERSEHRFSMKREDLQELSARAAEMVQPLLAEKNVVLRLEHANQPITATCDHDKIMQVFTNLLGNAIKFTPSGSGITLHTRSMDGKVEVAVIDEGIGIPEGETEMIFDSFRQSSRTNTGAGGTGLGLAICRGIVEAHGGKIWAENNKGAPGACVTFCLPVNQAEGNRTVKSRATEVWHEHAA